MRGRYERVRREWWRSGAGHERDANAGRCHALKTPEWMEPGHRWMGRCQAGGSGSEVVGDGLVELVFWNRIGLGEIELESLIQEEVTWRRAPGRSDGWGAMREVEVEEDTLDDGRIGEEGQDPHVSTTTRAQER